jgi:hypothetical protein
MRKVTAARLFFRSAVRVRGAEVLIAVGIRQRGAQGVRGLLKIIKNLIKTIVK